MVTVKFQCIYMVIDYRTYSGAFTTANLLFITRPSLLFNKISILPALGNSHLNGKKGLERNEKKKFLVEEKRKSKSSQKDKGVDKKWKIIFKMSLNVQRSHSVSTRVKTIEM